MNLVRKEGDSTKGLTERLLEELNCRTVFTIPVLGGIGVD
ncbi:MAG: F0F1 ATP synthase subunit A, partial [Lachnospiraceae bacterium]